MSGGRSSTAQMRRWSLPLAGLTILVAGGGVALYRGGGGPAAAAPEAAVPVVVRPVDAVSRPSTMGVSGEVEAENSANVAFQVAGVVAVVRVHEGDFVRAGQVLAELDPRDYAMGLELAAAQKDAAEDQYERARVVYDQNSLAPADFKKVEAAVRQARAQEAIGRKHLADTRLVAPIAGVIAHRGINPGEPVGPGMPVFTVVALDPVQVRVGIPETDIGRVHAGLRATVTIPALNDAPYDGWVRRVGVVADPVSRSYTVRVAVPNPGNVLRPGMIAEARIRDDSVTPALSVPGEAVVRQPDGTTVVYVYFPEQERVYARSVTIGSVIDRGVEVTSGLKGDEEIVVAGQFRVTDGTRVRAERDEPVADVGAEVRP